MGLDSEDWGTHFETLASYRTVVALSRRGHGTSAYSKPYAFSDFGEDIIETLNSLDVQKFDVLGISMGGCEALDLAIRYESKINGLTLVNTFAQVTEAERQERLSGLEKAFSNTTPSEYAVMLVENMTHMTLDAAEKTRLVSNFSDMPRKTFRELMEALYQIDLSKQLSKVTVPTRVFGAEFDKRTPPHDVAELAKKIPNATFESISSSGHFPHLEQPIEFQKNVLQAYLR